MRTGIVFASAAVVILSCSAPRYDYAPMITTVASLEGAPAAVYDIPPGSRSGEVQVAMLGIEARGPRGAIHVALAVANRSNEAWTVESSEQHVELMTGRDRQDIYATSAEVARPVAVAIPPRSTRVIQLYFPLPVKLEKATELPSFHVHWVVRAGAHVVAKHTRFQRFLVGRPPVVERDLGVPADLDDDAPSLPGVAPPDWRHVLPSGE
jgi:hypothetical protein